jgi:hypothetical protein
MRVLGFGMAKTLWAIGREARRRSKRVKLTSLADRLLNHCEHGVQCGFKCNGVDDAIEVACVAEDQIPAGAVVAGIQEPASRIAPRFESTRLLY